jgi:hypothetical protein
VDSARYLHFFGSLRRRGSWRSFSR